MIGPCKDRN